MKTTKDKICEIAIELFEKKGYDNVSLREIATTAGTTIGNLTYHFGQKEQLIDTIAERYQADFLPVVNPELSNYEILDNIVATFFKAQYNEEHAYVYYKNVYEFEKNSSSLKSRNEKFRKSLYDYYHDTFSILVTKGVLNKQTTIEDIELISYTFVFFTALWIQSPSPHYDKNLPSIPISKALFSILKPHLNDKYHKQYESLFHEYKQKYTV